jgi:hypothetical protein
VLRQIADRDFLDLALVVLNTEPPHAAEHLPARRFWSGRNRLLYRLYERTDAAIYGSPDDAFAPMDARPLVAAARTMAVKPLSPRPFEHRFTGQDIAAIRAENLDVLVRLGFNIVRGEILDAARFGVWSFHHGDNRSHRGGPSFFWEMYERAPVTGTTLQILTDELDGGHVIYRSQSATDPVSLRRGRNRPFMKAANFVVRRLTDLHRYGFDHLRALPTFAESGVYDRGIYRTPRNRVMAWFLIRTAAEILGRRMRRLALREEWFIAYRQSPEQRGELSQGPRFKRLTPPLGRYFADPFVVEHGGQPYIFFEDFDYTRRKGDIAFVAVNGSGPTAPATALARPYHMSYPCLFEHDGDVFMVPETSAVRRVELYRATRFPTEWELERILLDDIEAVDTTVVHRDGRFWLFANVAESGGPTVDELFLFSAESLDGEWVPHPMNPIVSDVRRARPAGSLFELDGRLIRPAQDCSVRYGSAVVLNEVTRLTVESYDEVPLGRIGPEWHGGNLGSHTYNYAGGIVVVDGLAPRRR